jgi:Protein C10
MQAMVDSLTEPENVKMLKEIRDDCKNDALRVMVYVYPQVVSIKIKAVEKYGIHGAQGLLKITHFFKCFP